MNAVYTSPLLRARQTSEILLKDTRLSAQFDDDLREIDFGRWECKTFEEITAEDAGAVKRWAAFDHRFAFPGGESLGGFLARMRRSARRLSEDPAPTVLVVTHGGIIRAMICHFLGLRPRQYVLFHIAHAACTVIDLYDGHGVLGLRHVCCAATALLGRPGKSRKVSALARDIQMLCHRKLEQIGDERGWSELPQVMNLDMQS